MGTGRRLSMRFYSRPAPVVAQALLGTIIVHGDVRGMIVETEAYLGPNDLASHARFGQTARNQPMFGPAGVVYMYLCYGVHDMFNIVTGSSGVAEAVLVRAAEILESPANPRRASGPGKLSKSLGLSRRHNRVDLCQSDELFLTAGRRVQKRMIAFGPRVGVDYAGACAKRQLRFWIKDHAAVSR